MKLYKVTGEYIIDEISKECNLEKALQAAFEYTVSRNQDIARVLMKVDTNTHPIEYVFGIVGVNLQFHEVCRVVEYNPYSGTAIATADRINEEFEKHYSLDFEKKGNAQYAHPETRVAWQYYLAGWRKAEQVL